MKHRPFYDAENVPSNVASSKTALCTIMPPVIDKPLAELRDVELQQLAVYSVVGEFTDPMLAHALVLQHLFSYHSPNVSMLDWMRHCLVAVPQEVGLVANKHLQKMSGRESTAHPLLWQKASKVVDDLVEHGVDILHLLYKVLGLNLRMCVWDDIVKTGLSPIASSQFMVNSRPCEHVVLTQSMIKWAVTIYFACHTRKIKCLEAGPWLTPAMPIEYKELESAVRALQRQCFPGLSSVQAERIILESVNEHRTNYNA